MFEKCYLESRLRDEPVSCLQDVSSVEVVVVGIAVSEHFNINTTNSQCFSHQSSPHLLQNII